jgi:hypothetical protein
MLYLSISCMLLYMLHVNCSPRRDDDASVGSRSSRASRSSAGSRPASGLRRELDIDDDHTATTASTSNKAAADSAAVDHDQHDAVPTVTIGVGALTGGKMPVNEESATARLHAAIAAGDSSSTYNGSSGPKLFLTDTDDSTQRSKTKVNNVHGVQILFIMMRVRCAHCSSRATLEVLTLRALSGSQCNDTPIVCQVVQCSISSDNAILITC